MYMYTTYRSCGTRDHNEAQNVALHEATLSSSDGNNLRMSKMIVKAFFSTVKSQHCNFF